MTAQGGRDSRQRLPGSLLAVALLLGLALGGCASAPQRSASSGAPVNAQVGCHAPPPNLRAAYNRTYTVRGRSYSPLRSADGYDEVGIASWYGWESGTTTSMGTRFNPRDFSAASRVLPLPTCVQVTNLDNGLSALVLVNDRGPFVSGRLLDLSMGAAQALGVTRTGTARVRIVALPEGANAPLQIAQAATPQPSSQTGTAPVVSPPSTPLSDQPGFAPQQFAAVPVTQAPSRPTPGAGLPQRAPEPAPIEVQTLPPLAPASLSTSAPAASASQGNAGPPQVSLPPTGGGLGVARPWGPSQAAMPAAANSAQPPMPQPALNLPASSASPQNYVQTGAFTLQANAEAEKARLQAVGIDDVQVVPGYIRGQTFYRVQIGPIAGAVLDATLVQKLQGLGLSGYSVVQQ